MKRSHALALACAFLLLESTMTTALARSPRSGIPSQQTRPLALVRDYIDVLNADVRTGNFSSLASVYAANATLTTYRSLPRDTYKEWTGGAHGLAAIKKLYGRIYYGFSGYRWTQVEAYTASHSRVISIERVQGPSGSRTLRSETVATIRGGKITHLDWTVDFGVY